MSIDEQLYQFASYHLSAEIPPFEEISHANLVVAAMVVFYQKSCSPEQTIYGMEKLGVTRAEILQAFLRIADYVTQRN